MPWTCPSCGGETDLGYNICWTCQAPRPKSVPENPLDGLVITTTSTITTHSIDEYFGPVFGETIFGANVIRDFVATISDIVGGRSGQYESVLVRGRNTAMAEMAKRAKELGANAVIGMRFDYSTIGNSMLMICCNGTAVKATPTS
ncbi:YbjQ family protein [Roseiconus lacunae]|uniref:YbjQ family protein n=1 Tax=Roseiconus lacunae TaxID=2605694 RepID=UPI0011F3A6DE